MKKVKIRFGNTIVETTPIEIKPCSKKQRDKAHQEELARRRTRGKALQTIKTMKPLR